MKTGKPEQGGISGSRKPETGQYLISAAITGIAALSCAPLAGGSHYHVVSFILLFVVSIMSTFLGIGPVLLASTLSALIWNFFFIPPQLTFHIDKPEDLLIFGLFFIIALVNGILTTRIRRQEVLAREREKRTESLFRLTHELSKASGIDEIVVIAAEKIEEQFSAPAFLILQDGNNHLMVTGRGRKNIPLSLNEAEAAGWVFSHVKKAGNFTAHPLTLNYTLYPLQGNKINPGVVAIRQTEAFNEEQQSYWDTFIAQITNALEREFLGELARQARFLAESDRLYKTLFNSISHELRIPVATIMGASDTILNTEESGNIQKELIGEIFTASLRLNRLIENLLNITRLESGHISVRLDWYDINDLINMVLEELEDELKPFSVQVSIPDDMPPVKIDFGLMEQVLYNLLYNAAQHAPAASEILLTAGTTESGFTLQLTDKGPGFPETALKQVFDKFYRVDNKKAGGLGLGLSIVKGFTEAHKGSIHVENAPGGGALFTLHIPSEKPDFDIPNQTIK